MPVLMPPPSELVLMLLADARLPVAGHTQSGGLEPALRDGLADVPAYVRMRLATVTRVEAATAVVARHHVLHGLPLAPVEAAWAARTPSAALRENSRQQGRALRRLAARLWDVQVPDRSPRPLVLGAVAATTGLTPLALAHLVGYDDVQTVSSAALKLLPLDPATVTAWVYDALPVVAELADAVAPITAPADVPASGAPVIEAWAEAHARTTRRLFSA